MRTLVVLAALGVAGAALAQVVYPPADLSAFDTPAQRDAAIAANTPSPCPAPLPDALTATAGNQQGCMTRPDAQRATQFPSAKGVTTSSGSFSVPWRGAPLASPPFIAFAQANTASAPVNCQVSSFDVNGASGQCWQSIPATIPGVVVGASATAASTYQNAAAGIPISVGGRL